MRVSLGVEELDSIVTHQLLSPSFFTTINSNPFDVLKTLAQTNQGKSIPLRELVGQMYHDQGLKGFYRGVQVNIMRACVLNATKMGVYDVAKGKVVTSTGWSRKDPRTAFCSSFVAGFFMTCTVVSWMLFLLGCFLRACISLYLSHC